MPAYPGQPAQPTNGGGIQPIFRVYQPPAQVTTPGGATIQYGAGPMQQVQPYSGQTVYYPAPAAPPQTCQCPDCSGTRPAPHMGTEAKQFQTR